MPSQNKVLLMGNLTREVEMRYTPSGTATAQFGIAINRKYKDKTTNETREDTTFVDVEAWGRGAELASQHLSTGKCVLIEGRLKLDTWDDKQTGQKRSKLKVVADNIQFVGGEGQKQASKPTQRQAAPQHETEEDIPF